MNQSTVTVGEFVRGTAGHMSAVVESGTPLDIRRHNREHATVVPTELWRRACVALARMDAMNVGGAA